MKKDPYIVERIHRCTSNSEMTIIFELTGLWISQFNKIYKSELDNSPYKTRGNLHEQKPPKKEYTDWSKYDKKMIRMYNIGMSYSEIGRAFGFSPYKIRHHLKKLEKEGLC